MVFISLEEYLTPFDTPTTAARLLPATPFELELPKPSMQVIVTPGSPPKTKATTEGAFRVHGHQSRRFSAPAPLAAAAFKASASSRFVVYVINRTTQRKWIVHKIIDEFVSFRRSMQQHVGGCHNFGCCGPLRRVVKSSLYNFPRRKKWNESKMSAACVRSTLMTEYLDDLLQSVYARDCECDSVRQARARLDEFLALDQQREMVSSEIIATAHKINQTTEAQFTTNENMPEIVRSDGECPICFGEIGNSTAVRLQCAHTYHTECLRLWLNVQQSCPICRVTLS